MTIQKGGTRKQRIRNVAQAIKAEQEARKIGKKPSFDQDWHLDWFTPVGKQNDIVESMDNNELTIIKAVSGTGKSTTVLWKALSEYKAGNFRQVWLVKNPTEVGDDHLGLLSGDKNTKLTSHIESMKTIFLQFMTKNKLENDLSNGNIRIDIPNYLLGMTIDSSVIILEEAQLMSPATIKLVSERAGEGSIVIVLGDPKQAYGIKKREDGLSDLIRRTTEEVDGETVSKFPDRVGFVQMKADHNMRSSLSAFVTELYEL